MMGQTQMKLMNAGETRDIKMTKDERLMQAVKRIKEQSEIWIDQVNSIGNQCAYTDRGLENILDLSKELDKIYNA